MKRKLLVTSFIYLVAISLIFNISLYWVGQENLIYAIIMGIAGGIFFWLLFIGIIKISNTLSMKGS